MVKLLTRFDCLSVLVLLAPSVFSGAASAQVEVKQSSPDQISISINGQPFSEFYMGATYPKPFLAPLRSASGQIVTRKYPMENVSGESRDHQHHRGLWVGYGEINGINFWENEFKYVSGQPKNYDTAKIGKVVLRKVNDVKSGKKSGKIDATFRMARAERFRIHGRAPHDDIYGGRGHTDYRCRFHPGREADHAIRRHEGRVFRHPARRQHD